jgi:signal transduction histidine kinase
VSGTRDGLPTSPGGSDPETKRERLAAIGEIAAEVAHELRNALQIISANAYLAKQDLSKSGPQLAKIERSARLAHGIVDDLMALARGEPAHAEPVLFIEIVLRAREDLAERSADYDDRIDPAQLEVRAHQGLLSRCLHVLYENAIAAAAPRVPTIETRAWSEAGGTGDARVVIEVADDGPGVPADIASIIFEPLVTARPGGTGLGLALARRVVAAHAGTIVLVPNAEGVTGARFRVELPSR